MQWKRRIIDMMLSMDLFMNYDCHQQQRNENKIKLNPRDTNRNGVFIQFILVPLQVQIHIGWNCCKNWLSLPFDIWCWIDERGVHIGHWTGNIDVSACWKTKLQFGHFLLTPSGNHSVSFIPVQLISFFEIKFNIFALKSQLFDEFNQCPLIFHEVFDLFTG